MTMTTSSRQQFLSPDGQRDTRRPPCSRTQRCWETERTENSTWRRCGSIEDSLQRMGVSRLDIVFVQETGSERIEYRFQTPVHLLILFERGVRREGDTDVEGLPRSCCRCV